jgi:hypothetical protein
MVDSAHPPGAQAWKGTAVRSLRSYVSWVIVPIPTMLHILAKKKIFYQHL